MNLREFTEAVDARSREMTREELQTAFHSLARKVPEESRKEFLEIMDQVKQIHMDKDSSKNAVQMARDQDQAEVKQEYARLRKEFARIQEEEVTFHAEGYEDYSSGCWDRFLRMSSRRFCSATMVKGRCRRACSALGSSSEDAFLSAESCTSHEARSSPGQPPCSNSLDTMSS